MPEKRTRRRDALTDVAAYYRDLGVTELFVGAGRAASVAEAPAVAEAAAPAPASAPRVSEEAAAFGAAPTLESLREAVAGCRRCRLCETRKQTVFADGGPGARLAFVGEAPGADEDAQGIPFVGRAGQLLTKMIESGMGLSRQDVYICNVLKCRPPENRNPEPDEVASCREYLEGQLALVKPEVIVGLGKFACQFLLGTDEGMTRIRGRWGEYRGIPVMPTYHPSFLLRQPERKKETWSDLQKVMGKLGLPLPPAR